MSNSLLDDPTVSCHNLQTKVVIGLFLFFIFFTAKSELDIEEYSFSQTTLEQVFLKFAHYDEISED